MEPKPLKSPSGLRACLMCEKLGVQTSCRWNVDWPLHRQRCKGQSPS